MVNVDKNDGLTRRGTLTRTSTCNSSSRSFLSSLLFLLAHLLSLSLSLSFYVFYLLSFFHLSSNQPVAGDVDKEREGERERGTEKETRRRQKESTIRFCKRETTKKRFVQKVSGRNPDGSEQTRQWHPSGLGQIRPYEG